METLVSTPRLFSAMKPSLSARRVRELGCKAGQEIVVFFCVFFVMACASPQYGGRLPPSQNFQAHPQLTEPIVVVPRRSPTNPADLLDSVLPREDRSPGSASSSDVGLNSFFLPKPGPISPSASMGEAVAANTLYYGISAAESGIQLVVGAAALLKWSLVALGESAWTHMLRVSSFVALHQLLCHQDLFPDPVVGATKRFTLIRGDEPLNIEWHLVAEHDGNQVWRLRIWGKQIAYAMMGVVQPSQRDKTVYVIDTLSSVVSPPTEWSSAMAELLLNSLEPPAPPAPLRPLPPHPEIGKSWLFATQPLPTPVKKRPIGERHEYSQLALAATRLPSLSSVQTHRCQSRIGPVLEQLKTPLDGGGELRQTYLCGYTDAQLLRVEQFDARGERQFLLVGDYAQPAKHQSPGESH